MELHLLEAIAVAAEWWRGNYNSQWSSLRVKYEQIQGYQKIILNQYKPISKFCLCFIVSKALFTSKYRYYEPGFLSSIWLIQMSKGTTFIASEFHSKMNGPFACVYKQLYTNKNFLNFDIKPRLTF